MILNYICMKNKYVRTRNSTGEFCTYILLYLNFSVTGFFFHPK